MVGIQFVIVFGGINDDYVARFELRSLVHIYHGYMAGLLVPVQKSPHEIVGYIYGLFWSGYFKRDEKIGIECYWNATAVIILLIDS